MSKYDDSNNIYGNKYDESKRFSKILFKPGRPALAQEINELQSMENHQTELLGDSLFQEGSIISGMSIIPKKDDDDSGDSNPNSFSVSSLNATHASLNTNTYTADSVIKVASANELDTDFPSIEFTGTATKGSYLTLSFSTKKISGTINKVGLDYDSAMLTPTKYTIDGSSIASSADDMTGNQIVDTQGNRINLNDTKEHKIVYTFRTLDSGTISFALAFNPGSKGLATAFVADWRGLMIEDGQKASDWQLNPNDDTTASSVNRVKNYTVSSGRIWLEGQVREFNEQEVSIKGTGTETLGVKLSEVVVTADDDPDLLDDTDGAVTQGRRGADRTRYQVVLTYNDESATPIFVFTNNKINPNAVKPDYGSLTNIMAKRTYDQSGSFRTSGFNVTPGNYALDDTKINLAIDSGQAYVRGYSISTSETQNMQTPKATETAQTVNEGYTYNTGSGQYVLSNQPVKEVNTVTANIRATKSVSRSTGGVSDTFSDEPAYRIVSITQNGIAFKQGTDFTTSGGTQIIWGQDPNGNLLVNATVPKAGSSYTVVYEYTHVLTVDEDYEVTTSDGTTSINISDVGGLKPVDGSVVTVSYVYFLARIDMIMVTQNQADPFKIVQGSPMPLRNAKPPVVNDPYSLELGYVLVYPNSDNAVFTMQTTTRVPFEDMQRWLTRIENLEYNTSVQELTDSVKKNEDPVNVRDAFSDEFNNANKADLDAKDFNVAYDLEKGEITIPLKAESVVEPNKDELTAASAYDTMGQLITAPYVEELALQQTKATGVINVNEWNVFSANGTLKITPNSDTWIDTKSTTVEQNQKGKHLNINRWWRHRTNTTSYYQSGDTLNYFNQLKGINWSTSYVGQQTTGYTISSGGTKTIESAIEYMRARDIKFTASNFRPYQDNFKVQIESNDVNNPKPESDTYKGSQAGTFKADGQGVIKGSFTIPGGVIKCGNRTVKISASDGSVATASYTAQGTMRDVQSIINKTTYSVSLFDPLAQSFTLDHDTQLTSVDLYFASKASYSDGHTPGVIVQIRELSDDGYPTRAIKAEKTLLPDDIKTSKDGSVATHVVFDDSTALTGNQGYAITLIADSNKYSLYKASKGERLIGNDNSMLTAAPNPNGTVFTSQNAQTWVADPGTSLKFRVSTAHFNNRGVIEFTPVDLTQRTFDDSTTTSKTDRLVLMATYLTPQNTGMTWYLRVLPNSSGSSISNQPYEAITAITGGTPVPTPGADPDDITDMRTMLESSKQIQLKATFDSSRYISPIVSLEDLTIPLMLSDTQGTYLSVNVDESGSAGFNQVKVQYDAYTPEGSTVTPYYSIDGGVKWYTLADNGTSVATPSSRKQISSYFDRYIFKAKVPGAVDQNHLAEQFKVKLVLKSQNNFQLPRVRKLVTAMKFD